MKKRSDMAKNSDGYCTECHGQCKEVRRDFGRGLTEYWGAVSAHEDWRWVSECCDAEVVESLEEEE